MKAELIYSHFVKSDLKEIHDWYKNIDKKLWNKFKQEFQSKINFIKENPLIFEIRYDRQRILFLKKFLMGFISFMMKNKTALKYIQSFTLPEILNNGAENKNQDFSEILVFIYD